MFPGKTNPQLNYVLHYLQTYFENTGLSMYDSVFIFGIHALTSLCGDKFDRSAIDIIVPYTYGSFLGERNSTYSCLLTTRRNDRLCQVLNTIDWKHDNIDYHIKTISDLERASNLLPCYRRNIIDDDGTMIILNIIHPNDPYTSPREFLFIDSQPWFTVEAWTLSLNDTIEYRGDPKIMRTAQGHAFENRIYFSSPSLDVEARLRPTNFAWHLSRYLKMEYVMSPMLLWVTVSILRDLGDTVSTTWSSIRGYMYTNYHYKVMLEDGARPISHIPGIVEIILFYMQREFIQSYREADSLLQQEVDVARNNLNRLISRQCE